MNENREEIWQRLMPSLQLLFISLYGSRESFVSTEIISPIEKYIIQYNDLVEEPGNIRQIAFRLGAEMPLNVDEDIYIYWVFSRVVDIFGLTQGGKGRLPSLGQVIDMTHNQYLQWLKEEGDNVYTYYDKGNSYFETGSRRTTDTYHLRLIIFMDAYQVGNI